MSKIEKVLLIGWDGATWEYIDPMLENGELPNLEKLIRQGARATLKSTTPPYTAIAWPALVSGSSPASTGIYDTVQFSSGDYSPKPARNNQAIPIWHWVNRFGRRAGVLNVPMTFPAPALDGYVVSGFDSPRDSSKTEHPQGTLEKWANQGVSYRTLLDETALMDTQNPHQRRGDLEAFTEAWVKITHAQGDHLAWLWEHDPVELLFVVFSGTDSINHRTRDTKQIQRVYRAADAALGKVLQAVGERTLVCLVSDHGSTPAHRYISLNRILYEQGWIRYKNEIAAHIIQSRFGPYGPSLAKVWTRLPVSVRQAISAAPLKIDRRLNVSYENVHWKQTKIFFRSSLGLLYINLKGRFPDGSVNLNQKERLLKEAIDHLQNLTDKNEKPIFRQISRGQELYSGTAPDSLIPDLILEPNQWSDHMISGYTDDPILRPIPTKQEYGTHTPDGIILLAGPGIKPNFAALPTQIQDVFPTIMAVWGLPIPDSADGTVNQQFFTKKMEAKTASTRHEPEKEIPAAASDSDEILERLRALGYLD